MTNWCTGDLIINGPSEICHRFFQRARSNRDSEEELLDADKFIPYPEEYKELDRKWNEWKKAHPGKREGEPKNGFNSGGHDWCCTNWGTKWGFCEVHLEGRYPLVYRFETAWGPISPVIIKMGEEFSELEFVYEYEELSNDFAGRLVIRDGEIVEEDDWVPSEVYGNEEEEEDDEA